MLDALRRRRPDPRSTWAPTPVRRRSSSARSPPPHRFAVTRVGWSSGSGGGSTHLSHVIGIAVIWSWFAVDGASSVPLYRGGLLLHSVGVRAGRPPDRECHDGRSSSVLSWGPLPWIGMRSYGLYLWHWPVYVALSPERTEPVGVAAHVPAHRVSTAAAYASYRLVEDPIRHRATWAHGRSGTPRSGRRRRSSRVLDGAPRPRCEIAAFDPASIDVATTGPSTVVPGARHPDAGSVTVDATTRDRAESSTTTPGHRSGRDGGDGAPSNGDGTDRRAGAGHRRRLGRQTADHDRVLWTGDSSPIDLRPGCRRGPRPTPGRLADSSSAFPGIRLVGDDRDRFAPVCRGTPGSGADMVVVQLSMWDARAPSTSSRAGAHALRAVARGQRAALVSSRPRTARSTRRSDRRDWSR